MTTVSIVIHKTPQRQLDKVMECLLRSGAGRIFIIDNSPEGYPRPALPDDARIDYLRVENRGFGAGHNLAIRKVTAEARYHLVLNADVWWEGDVIGELQKYMDSHPEAGMVAPKVFYPDGRLQYTCRMLPTPVQMFARAFLPGVLIRKMNGRYLLTSFGHDEPVNCPYLLGCFMMLRVEALAGSGAFDERFFMYPEDIDLTRRLHEMWETVYYPSVSIIHEHARSSRKSVRMFAIHLANMVRYFNKWGWWRDPLRKRINRILTETVMRGNASSGYRR